MTKKDQVRATTDLTVETLWPVGTKVKFLRDVTVREAFIGLPEGLVEVAVKVKEMVTGNVLAFKAGETGVIEKTFSREERRDDDPNEYLIKSHGGGAPAFAPGNSFELSDEVVPSTIHKRAQQDTSEYVYPDGFVVGAKLRANSTQTFSDIFEGRANPLINALLGRKFTAPLWNEGDTVELIEIRPEVIDPLGKKRGVISVKAWNFDTNGYEEWPTFAEDFSPF